MFGAKCNSEFQIPLWKNSNLNQDIISCVLGVLSSIWVLLLLSISL